MTDTIADDNPARDQESTIAQNALTLIELGRKKAAVYKRIRTAVINAIPHELAATNVIFGDTDVVPVAWDSGEKIHFATLSDALGNDVYVAIAGTTGQGLAQAAAATAQLAARCIHLKKVILIGIAAGQPNMNDKEKDVRLGDVVIGDKLIQYDHIKLSNGKSELRGNNIAPGDRALLAVVDQLRSLQDRTGPKVAEKPWEKHIRVGCNEVRFAARPDASKDSNTGKRSYTKGLTYDRADDRPFIHVGTIGSANTLLKDATYRDGLNRDHGTIAYEMEGAGVAIAAAACNLSYLSIRGICDYADMEKNDDWQTYASVCAAAIARTIIEAM